MAIGDRAAAFLSQVGSAINPSLQTFGANIASGGARTLQKGANVLADVGDAAFRQGGVMGNVQPSLSNASNILHTGSQNLFNMTPEAQAALGYGGVGAAALTAGAAATGIARTRRSKKERMSGQNLGTQLGVQMPIIY
jgi:hypothetical protein